MKYKELPHQNQNHPVLPYRSSTGRLLFALCKTCALESLAECTHASVEERTFADTRVIDEVRKAVELGYLVLKFMNSMSERG